MKELIKVTTNENDEQLVSARDLHKGLEIKTRFSQWVTQNFKPFREGVDFSPVVTTTQQNQYGERNYKTTLYQSIWLSISL